MLLVAPTVTLASNNAGIVRGLWYSEENFFAGEPLRVYVAIRNNTGSDLSGTVEFFVNNKKIERSNIDALDGRIIESWADWTPTYGTSTITATLSRTEISSTASGTRAVEATSALAEDIIFVDYDTDQDGIGNLEDKDDDGDGKTDLEEKAAGTDPLRYDEPPRTDKSETGEQTAEANSNDSTTAVNSGSYNHSYENNPTGASEGLEQFLTPSRADTMLNSVTDVVRTTKKKLDDYRAERQQQIDPPAPSEVKVNEDGFGEIERISKDKKKAQESKPVAEKPEGFFGDLLTFLGNIISGVYTVILGALSFALGYPALIQIILLILILYITYRLARKFGRRPN